jgi:hypothetical protein
MQIFPRAPNETVRTASANAWRNLTGVATPDGPHPTGRRVSLLRYRIGAVLALFIGLATAYAFIVRPIVHAKGSGEIHPGVFGLCIPAFLLYAGIAQLLVDIRDEKSLRIGGNGRLRFTRTARLFEWGGLVAVAVICVAWYLYARSLGFDIYLQGIPLPTGK